MNNVRCLLSSEYFSASKKLRILMSRSLGRKRFWFQQNRQENPVNTNENQEVNNDSKL